MNKKSRIALCLFLSLFFLISCQIDNDLIIFSAGDITGAPQEWEAGENAIEFPVATVSLQCSSDPVQNRIKITEYVDLIMLSNPETRLIQFGETITGWYYLEGTPAEAEVYQRSIAETDSGLTAASVSGLALEYGIYIAYGFTEVEGDNIYNCAVVIGPDGSISAKHRKVHMTPWDIDNGFSVGSGVTNVSLDGINAALMICYDFHDINLYSEIVESDTQIILGFLADTVDEGTPFDVISRSYNKWVIFSNRYGNEGDIFYEGHCGVYDPAGYKRVHTNGKEGYLTYRVEVNQ